MQMELVLMELVTVILVMSMMEMLVWRHALRNLVRYCHWQFAVTILIFVTNRVEYGVDHKIKHFACERDCFACLVEV